MREGLEYAIKILEGRAARHKKMLSGDFSKSGEYIQLRHHNEMEACLSAARALRRKLRQCGCLHVEKSGGGSSGEHSGK